MGAFDCVIRGGLGGVLSYWRGIVSTAKPAQCSLMIDALGTEEYLPVIDGTHTIGFSASCGFPRDWVYITSTHLNVGQIKTMMLFDYPKGRNVSERNVMP